MLEQNRSSIFVSGKGNSHTKAAGMGTVLFEHFVAWALAARLAGKKARSAPGGVGYAG